MKYVYVIISKQCMHNSACTDDIGKVDFAFTNIKKAREQMLKIKELIEQGEWYANDCIPTKHTIESFHEYNLKSSWYGLMMSIKVLHSRNGVSSDSHSIYSLYRRELNEGYGI